MTPFEIRLDLVKIARDLLVEEYKYKCERITTNWKLSVENSHAAGNIPTEHPEFPNYPTEDDIVRKVQALNNFVSNTPLDPVKPTRKT
jgi:hypothetical protein